MPDIRAEVEVNAAARAASALAPVATKYWPAAVAFATAVSRMLACIAFSWAAVSATPLTKVIGAVQAMSDPQSVFQVLQLQLFHRLAHDPLTAFGQDRLPVHGWRPVA